MEKLQKIVGNRLKHIREEYFRLNQTNFASELKTNQTTLSKYENGSTAIPDELKFILSEKGINTHWLLTGKGEPFLSDNLPAPKDLQLFLEFEKAVDNLINTNTDPKFAKHDSRLNSIEESLKKHDEAIKALQQVKLDRHSAEIIEDKAPEYTAVKAKTVLPDTEDDYIEEEYIDLPLAVNLAAGVPIEATDTGDTYPVPLRLIPKKPGSQYCAAQIAGTSMTESGINDGDYVLLEYFDEPINNEFMVVKYGSETTLKLLRRNKRGGWELWYQDGSGQKIALQDGDWEVKGKFICVLPKKP